MFIVGRHKTVFIYIEPIVALVGLRGSMDVWGPEMNYFWTLLSAKGVCVCAVRLTSKFAMSSWGVLSDIHAMIVYDCPLCVRKANGSSHGLFVYIGIGRLHPITVDF